MIKNKLIILLVSITVLICPTLIACGSVKPPNIGHIPDGWWLSDAWMIEGQYLEEGTDWGLIEYTDDLPP
jgi:hypothetical protein